MYEELKNRFGDTTNGQILCRMAKDMTEIERQRLKDSSMRIW